MSMWTSGANPTRTTTDRSDQYGLQFAAWNRTPGQGALRQTELSKGSRAPHARRRPDPSPTVIGANRWWGEHVTDAGVGSTAQERPLRFGGCIPPHRAPACSATRIRAVTAQPL